MKPENLLAQLDQQRRKVDFDTYDVIVQQLVTMVESGTVDVAPAYQRQFRWDNEKRSHLIESVLLGVPVPSLFMAANKDGTWELVDGVQLLSTLVQFAGTKGARARLSLTEPLVLDSLDKLTEFNGLKFDDFPVSLKLQFYHRPIKIITLSDKSDLVVRFDLFERLNTGGVALTNQEIRACIYRGEFSGFLERMAAVPEFRKTVKLTQAQEHDGTREECVLRFFAFLHRYKNFVHSVVAFLNDYMDDASKRFDYAANERLFSSTFRRLAKALPNGIVRGPGRKLTPLNLFEGVSVGAALAMKQRSTIKAASASRWIQSEELRRLTTGPTNNRAMVVGRIEFCRDRFLA
jgi:Protein of unknown function DUF262